MTEHSANDRQAAELLQAVRSSDPAPLIHLVEGGLSPDTRLGESPLLQIAAAFQGTGAVVRALLEMGADPNARGDFGQTPLMAAAAAGQRDHVALLLQRGADVHLVDELGGNALLHAVLGLSELEPAARVEALPRYLAVMELLLGRGAEVTHRAHDGTSALHLAVHLGDLGLVGWILDRGADVNAPPLDHDLAVPPVLVAAAERGDGPMVALLLDRGADPRLPDREGRTALLAAIRAGQRDVVKLLLERTGGVNVRAGKWGWTPLTWAAYCGSDLEMIDLLLEQGADLSVADRNGHTALALAFVNRRDHIVERILRSGHREPGMLGVVLHTPGEAARPATDVQTAAAVVVKNVLCDSAADRADLRAEDIIFAINGKPVDSMDAFWQRLGEFAAGDTIRCSVLRAGNRLEKKVWLGPRASGILKF